MYFNKTQCDIYIGTGAGKKLMAEMSAAQKSVHIVSPFLSANLVDGLIQLHNKGIDVELITTEEGQARTNGFLRRLVQQQVYIDGKARAIRKRLKRMLWGCYVLGGFLLMALWWFFTQQDLKNLLVTLVILGVVTLTILFMRYFIRNKKVYSYAYRPLFPVKVIRPSDEFGQRTTYLHSKIYIIDESIAYLGSLNFTRSGTGHNHETRVRIMDDHSVAKIVEEFHYLMDEANFPVLDFNDWGKRRFQEPLN